MIVLKSIEQDLRTNKYLAAAVADLDGFDHARTVAAEARALLRQVEEPQPIADPLDSGELPTMEWARRDVDYRAAAEQAQKLRTRLDHLAIEAESRASGIVSGASNDLLSRFDTELQSLMDQAAELASELDGARTAAESIDRGPRAVDAWRKLTEGAASVAELRSAQMRIMLALHTDRVAPSRSNYSDDPLASDLVLSNLDEVWPGWRQPPPNRIDLSGGPGPRLEPWPTDAAEQLVWLATGPAKPWCPTITRLDKLHQKRDEKAAIENARKRAEQRGRVFDERKFRARKPHRIGGEGLMR